MCLDGKIKHKTNDNGGGGREGRYIITAFTKITPKFTIVWNQNLGILQCYGVRKERTVTIKKYMNLLKNKMR